MVKFPLFKLVTPCTKSTVEKKSNTTQTRMLKIFSLSNNLRFCFSVEEYL